jgi:hypothetical protein
MEQAGRSGTRGIGDVRWVAILVGMALAACQREAPAPQGARQAAPAAQPAAAPVALKDVSETDPRYIVGISYPPQAVKYPGLAAALQQYANAARSELMEAVEGLGDTPPSSPYDLSLAFTTLVESPQVVAVAADGSTYTGGAHGNPLIARFVWLPAQSRMLTATELMPDAKAWEEISGFAREQLHTSLSQRIDGDDMQAADRAELLRSAGRMIDDGTAPEPANFAQFEPLMGTGGKIRALRFVFPPYQVGPYSDGTQTVDVPAALLLPNVAPAYRSLFATG